jgi:glyoxylase-like metal-dependent hydrolase (beta-lactamase superfamily II)
MQPADDFCPVYGEAQTLEPMLRRILAPNPSPMTYRGTNTYLLGDTGIAVIDPGPDDDAHLKAICDALGNGQYISHIIVSHAHLDHSPLAARLSKATAAPVYGFGPAHAGRSPVMAALAETGLAGGGEGVDLGFHPQETVVDGDLIEGENWVLRVLHTPGHIGNHICLGWGDACFTADHVMGWASSLVSPPDGDLTDFMASCARLQREPWRIFYPGHGAQIEMPDARLDWLVAHRRGREASILDALSAGPRNAAEIARVVYNDISSGLLPAAERNVLAHLIDLEGKSKVRCRGPLGARAPFEWIVQGSE